MTTVTHALAPIILVRLFARDREALSKWDYILIGIAGGLADIINPHYYLRDRLTSWSHGLPFWFTLSIVLIILALLSGRFSRSRIFRLSIALFCSLAYLLHLFCDGISGGINLLYPVQDFFWGVTLIPFPLWIPLDVLNIAIVYILFRKKDVAW